MWKRGLRKSQNHTMQIHYKFDSHSSAVLADLLYKTKPHYSEDRTMQIRTMRRPTVYRKKKLKFGGIKNHVMANLF